MIDKEILTVEDIADILGFDAAKVRAMLEDGSFPCRQIAGAWFTTKRQFLDYIENGLPKAAEEAPATTNHPAPTKFRSNIGTNAWECKACNALNEALRAECLSCGYARSMPLIDFASHSLPPIEIPEDMNLGEGHSPLTSPLIPSKGDSSLNNDLSPPPQPPPFEQAMG